MFPRQLLFRIRDHLSHGFAELDADPDPDVDTDDKENDRPPLDGLGELLKFRSGAVLLDDERL